MPKAINSGGLATGESETGLGAGEDDANSMDLGSDGAFDDSPSNDDINDALGLSPADDDNDLDDAGTDEESPQTDDLNEGEDPAEDADAAEGEEESEEVESESEEEEQPEASATQARIDALTREKKEAKEALEAAEARAEELERKLAERPTAAAGPDSGAFDHVDSLEGLAEARRNLLSSKRFLLQNLDGFTRELDGQEREFSAEDARAMLADVEGKLDEDLPMRAQYLQASARFQQEARVAYPDLFKKGTEMHGLYLEALKELPGLRGKPNAHLIVGDAAIGYKVRSGEFKLVPVKRGADGKVLAPAKPPAEKPKNVAPKAAGAAAPAAGAKRGKAEQRLAQSDGSIDDIAAFLIESEED